MTKNSNTRMQQREFLDIPYTERIVPFPNFASVLMQHAREFPDKIALDLSTGSYTYADLLKTCLALELKLNLTISMKDTENDLILLLALLAQGIPFNLDLKSNSTLKLHEINRREIETHFFEPPYVRLDDEAMILNKELSFSQYNILVAAQAIGNAFKLFRPGNALCALPITNVADLSFGILAPLYFAKSIYFINVADLDFFQYAWKGDISSRLRDTVMVSDDINYHKNAYHLQESYEEALGLGPVLSSKGELVKLLGVDIEKNEDKWTISGHCLGENLK